MKKIVLIVFAIAMVLSAFALSVFAADTTVYTAENGGIIWDGGYWLSNDTNNGGEGGRTITVKVNTDAPILECGIPQYWASNPAADGQTNAVIKIAVYKFVKNYETSVLLAPVAEGQQTLEGDSPVGTTTTVAGTNCSIVANGNVGAYLVFDTPLEAGEYLVQFSQVANAVAHHYLVMPATQEAYGDNVAYYLNGKLDNNLTVRMRVLLQGEGSLQAVTADVTEESLKRDFDSAKGDKLSYDQILVNGTQIANGNSAVIEAKQLIDGSDGSITTVAMHGWYGNASAKIISYGYMIDGGEPVYGEFKVATEDDVIAAGGESRFTVTVDVTGLNDGGTHKIQVVAKLDNGDVVILNRFESGKDRDVYVNYKAAQPEGAMGTNLDALGVNENTYPPTNNLKGEDKIVISKGDKIYILGWAYNTVANVSRVYWTLDGVEKECSNVYRKRTDLAGATSYIDKCGFGEDNNFMELLGVDELARKTTAQVAIIAEFANGQTAVIKEFTLVVAGTVQLSLDGLAVNEDTYPIAVNYNGDDATTITIEQGDKMNLLGWIAKYGTNLDKIYWQYIVGEGHAFDEEGVEIVTKECSNTYRERKVISEAISVPEEYLLNAGFGLDNDLMEMLGVDELEPGTYTVRVRALFLDGSESAVKKKFTLVVNEKTVTEEPTVKVVVGETATNVKPDAVSGVVLSADGDKLVATTNADAGDPWISIPLDNIDTNVYTSISVKYTVDPGMHGNNIYLRDTTVNPGYSGTAGTWCAPDMNARTEKTYFIVASFSTMAGTQLTGIRFPGATAGGTLTIESITFRTKDETEYTNFVDYDDVESYGMSFDYFYWNGNNLGGGRAIADVFVRPDAMPVDDYGGIATGYSGWVAFKQKVKAFGYIIDGKLVTNEAFYQSNENGLSALVDGWDGWKGSGETMQRFIIAVPFEGQSGTINVVAAAVLEDGTVVKLNSKAVHDRDTEINFVFNDVRDYYGDPATIDTGYWNNPFNKDSVASINVTADEWFNGFEIFIYASDVAQNIHVTVKDSEGNVVWEEDFTISGNHKYTFYTKDAKFAPGDYTIEFDGRNIADGDGTWIVFGATTPVDGKTATASGNYGSNSGYTALYFDLIKTTPFVEYMSRDQVTIDGVDKANFGGNAEVTDIADNLYADFGKQLRIWGWYGNNYALDKYGVRVDGGEIQYFDRYEAEDIVNHFKANLIKDDDVYASRFEIFVDITEGQHTAEVFAIVNGEERLIWTINYDCMPEEVPQTTEPGTEPPQTGDALLAMFAVIAVLAMGAAVVFARRKAH